MINARFSLQPKYSEPSMLKVYSINSIGYSLIRLRGNAVYRVEKSSVEELDARKPVDFNS